jgi:LysR family transcriptional regulator, transcriptional activator of nhaA
MLNYNHLYYFHVAATEGSLTAAATKLGVKQSTVSEQLRALEQALQRTLFERTSSGMRLTPAGQLAYEHTTAMFRAGDRLVQAIGGKQAVPTYLRVGISAAVARSTSTDFLLPLFAFDDGMPTITTGDTLEMIRELRGNELDLVLCENEPANANQGLVTTVVGHIPLVAIAPTNAYPGSDWQELGLIQYRASSSYHWEIEQYLRTKHLRPRVVGEADDPMLLVEAAARGGYVVIVPRSVARDALAAGRVRVLAQLDSPQASVFAVYQDGTAADMARRAVESLIATVKDSAD